MFFSSLVELQWFSSDTKYVRKESHGFSNLGTHSKRKWRHEIA